MRECAGCNSPLARSEYSKNQWAKGPGSSRCKTCVSCAEAAEREAGKTGNEPAAASPEPALVCANCGGEADKLCTGCRSVRYCGRDCQVAHRKAHRKRCKEIGEERLLLRLMESLPTGRQPEPEEHLRGPAAVGEKRQAKPSQFLDVDLVPSAVWNEALSLVEIGAGSSGTGAGGMKDAAWSFLLALFLDFGQDGNDMLPASKAVRGCGPDDPVAVALSIATWYSENRFSSRDGSPASHLAFCEDVCKRLAAMTGTGGRATTAATTSIDQVDRAAFALGAAKIFHARILARYHIATNPMAGLSKANVRAWCKAADIIEGAKTSIDPDKWLTYQ